MDMKGFLLTKRNAATKQRFPWLLLFIAVTMCGCCAGLRKRNSCGECPPVVRVHRTEPFISK